MAFKPGNFAILEGIQAEMRTNPHLTIFWQDRPTAVSPTGKVIDLGKEFGDTRIPKYTAIDEEWYIGACAGMALTGVPAIAHSPLMCTTRAIDLMFNQIGKLRHMTGGQASMPFVLWQDGSGRAPGLAGQHADAGQEALYAGMPGLKVVVPSNPYTAKGLMIAALRDPDPVVFFHYGAINSVQVDVPDEAYELKIGEGKLVQEGKDITILGYGPAMVEINKAIPELKKAGINAEVIDPLSLKPMPIEMILASAKKTGRLLTVDHGHETLGSGSEIIARVAIAQPGIKCARITFPDAPAPGNREMIQWMTPDASKVVAAAKKLLTV